MHNRDQLQVTNTRGSRAEETLYYPISTLQVTELATSFDEQFEIIPNVVDGEDAYKKLEEVGIGSLEF